MAAAKLMIIVMEDDWDGNTWWVNFRCGNTYWLQDKDVKEQKAAWESEGQEAMTEAKAIALARKLAAALGKGDECIRVVDESEKMFTLAAWEKARAKMEG